MQTLDNSCKGMLVCIDFLRSFRCSVLSWNEVSDIALSLTILGSGFRSEYSSSDPAKVCIVQHML